MFSVRSVVRLEVLHASGLRLCFWTLALSQNKPLAFFLFRAKKSRMASMSQEPQKTDELDERGVGGLLNMITVNSFVNSA